MVPPTWRTRSNGCQIADRILDGPEPRRSWNLPAAGNDATPYYVQRSAHPSLRRFPGEGLGARGSFGKCRPRCCHSRRQGRAERTISYLSASLGVYCSDRALVCSLDCGMLTNHQHWRFRHSCSLARALRRMLAAVGTWKRGSTAKSRLQRPLGVPGHARAVGQAASGWRHGGGWLACRNRHSVLGALIADRSVISLGGSWTGLGGAEAPERTYIVVL